MSVKFNVKMTDKYMYDFMLYHNYTHASGLMTAIAGVLCLAVFIQKLMDGEMQACAIWLMCAILFLIISPSSMKAKAKSQVNNTEMFQKPLEYEFTEEGITVRQEEAKAETKWEEVTKAVSTQKSVILYLGRVRALILPKVCMGDQYEEAVKMIHTHISPNKVKIRHIH
jgi:hypothetical protein